jgi:CheY-like chemotaxis protein
VLVVEDDAASRKLEAVVLTDAGALVTAVESAEEAAIALSRQRPDAERVALRAGCAAYLRKPIDTETFAAAVAKHLGHKS